MEYAFLDRDDETLIETSELTVTDGIAVAVRTTGYEIGTDEVVQISIVDFEGNELFAQTVKPQNIEEWSDEPASGGIMPADVAEAPELFQFEDQIIELFDNASIVVGQHMGFIHEIIESSWVSLPKAQEFDLSEQFCASHCMTDYPGKPATVVALDAMATYYEVPCDESTTTGIARAVAQCYVKLVEEHAAERSAKGSEYWAEYDRKQEEAALSDKRTQAAKRAKEIKMLRINALLWLCAAAIFANLAVQMHIRAINFGFVALAAVAAAYFAIRWIMCLYNMYKLSQQNKQMFAQQNTPQDKQE